MLFGGFFKDAITVNASTHPAMHELQDKFHGAMAMAEHGLVTWPFWLAVAGVVSAFYCYMINPALPAAVERMFKPVHTLLVNKYYLDAFNEQVLARGTRYLASVLWKRGDQALIDGWLVNGSWRLVGRLSNIVRRLQSGFLYHYALLMILGVFGLITWFVWLKP